MNRVDAAQEIATYLAGPVPDGAVGELRDLGLIGFANELPGISPETMRTLIAGARQKGRSWEEIGRRLDMTPEEAERTYQKLSHTDKYQPKSEWRHIIAGVIGKLALVADSVSDAFNRVCSRRHVGRTDPGPASRLGWVNAGYRVLTGSRRDAARLERHQARTIEISSEAEPRRQVDGEMIAPGRPLTRPVADGERAPWGA
jgi:hypothetical protein